MFYDADEAPIAARIRIESEPSTERGDLLDRLARMDRTDLMFSICPDLTHTIHTGHLACEAAADAVEANVRRALADISTPPGEQSA